MKRACPEPEDISIPFPLPPEVLALVAYAFVTSFNATGTDLRDSFLTFIGDPFWRHDRVVLAAVVV